MHPGCNPMCPGYNPRPVTALEAATSPHVPQLLHPLHPLLATKYVYSRSGCNQPSAPRLQHTVPKL